MPSPSKLFHRCPDGCVPMLRCSNPDEPSLLFCLVRGNHFTLTCKCPSNAGSTNSTTCEEGAEVSSCYNSYGNPITSIQTIEECIDIGGTWKTYCDPDYIDDQCTCPSSTTGLCSKSCKVVATCSSSGTTHCLECLENVTTDQCLCPTSNAGHCASGCKTIVKCSNSGTTVCGDCIARGGKWSIECQCPTLRQIDVSGMGILGVE